MARYRGKTSDAARRQTKQQTSASLTSKIRKERALEQDAANIATNELIEEQAAADDAAWWEGSWMKIAGTVVALVAVAWLTGGAGVAAYMSTGGSALAVGAASAVGTFAGMGIADMGMHMVARSLEVIFSNQ